MNIDEYAKYQGYQRLGFADAQRAAAVGTANSVAQAQSTANGCLIATPLRPDGRVDTAIQRCDDVIQQLAALHGRLAATADRLHGPQPQQPESALNGSSSAVEGGKLDHLHRQISHINALISSLDDVETRISVIG